MVTLLGVAVLGVKTGIALLSSLGVVTGVSWFNKKNIGSKKGGSRHEGNFDIERFNRRDTE